MRIVNREQFLQLPEETVFSKYKPCKMEGLSIKGETLFDRSTPPKAIDFRCSSIADEGAIDSNSTGELFDMLLKAEKEPLSMPTCLEQQYRDGCHGEPQLFAIWESKDLSDLIQKLTHARLYAEDVEKQLCQFPGATSLEA